MGRLPRTAKPIPDAMADWAPLNAVVPEIHRRDFRWIVALRMTDGTRIDVFAHTFTNCELLLGDDGTAFSLTKSLRYKQEDDVAWIVERALPHRWHWLEMGGYLTYGMSVALEEDWDGEFPCLERHRPPALVPAPADSDEDAPY